MIKKIRSFLFENKTAKQTIAKNTFWASVSNFGGRALKAIIIIYAARVLGTNGYGVFSYAVTLAAFFTLFVDPGVNSILIRESAKADEKERETLFATTFIMKLCIVVLIALVVLFVAPLFSTLPGAKVLLPLVVLIFTFDSLREFFSSLIRSMEKMEWEAAIFLFTNLMITVAGFIFLHIALTPLAFTWAYVAGTAIGAVVAAYVVRRYLKKIFFAFAPRRIIPILQAAWPFAITGALGGLLTNTDILIISWMRSAGEVGIYSAAIRIIQLMYLVPGILQLSTLPMFARLANKDNERFRAALERTVSFIFFASVPLALGGAILGTQIMQLVFGAAYASGGLSFKILMITLLFDYPAVIVSNAIFAYNHQKSLIVSSAIGAGANVALDLLLIPFFGIAGSATATLIAQALSNWYLWHAMKKINPFEVLPHLRRIITAGVLMAAATTLLFVAGANVIANIVVCALLYFGLLYAFREPLLKEIKRIIVPPSAAAAG